MSKEKQAAETKKTFKRGKALQLASMSIAKVKEGESLFVEFTSEIDTRPQTDDAGEPKMENGKPLMISSANVVDLETGVEGEMVLTFMMMKGIAKLGLDTVAGARFEFQKGKKVNRTNLWSTWALES